MTCDFSLDHYRELLEAARDGGYTWAGFRREPCAGDVIVRHDVDLSLDAALRMAEFERELGVTATYFLMTESGFYNLDSEAGRRAHKTLRDLGHAVGLHALHPNTKLDGRFDDVISWHNPDPEYMTAPIAGAVNVMQPPYFTPGNYRSDSNAHWREGCPHAELAAGAFEWLQVLIHPEIWVYEGTSMRETMESMLDAKRAEWLDALADDRIDLL